jgi:hypothetical protein
VLSQVIFIHLMCGSRTPFLKTQMCMDQCLFQSLLAVTRQQCRLLWVIKNIILYMLHLVTSPTQLNMDMGTVSFLLPFFLSQRVCDHSLNHLDIFVFTADRFIFKQANANENGLVADNSLLCQARKLELKGRRACQDLYPSLMRRQVTCLLLKTIAECLKPVYLYSR